MASTDAIAEVVDYWRSAGSGRWFAKDRAFDAAFHDRFLDLHFSAARGERTAWANRPDGALALLILLDQFPRNAFRGTAHMYATDLLAHGVADRALRAGHDQAVGEGLRLFFYLPFAHAEALADQDRSVALNRRLGGSFEARAREHRAIIRRFGRFPHRNAIFGRESTAQEQAFLDNGGFAG